ncbi:SLBB domain-containing protein, partial [bacterium]|nr:SLBB domain-containing protein [bacterium]
GAGFPTYVKFQATKVDTIVANGSECEPLLWTDKTMMMLRADMLVRGVQLAMKATGASKGIIGVKGHYSDVVALLNSALPKDGSIKLHLLNNYYPAGDEFLLVRDTTGRIIPEGGIPLNVGVVVSNVITFMQVADAENGVPVTKRALTITGEVKEPCVVEAPIGTTYSDLLNFAGGVTTDDPVIIDGGPMMGVIVDDWDGGIAKTTSGILVLPRDHFIIRSKTTTIAQMIKKSKAACCQCSRCTDLCPRNMLGHELHPHMAMRTIDYNHSEPTKHITSAYLCSQCGTCELIACDFMILSPKKVYAEYRKELVKRGIKNPHNNKPEDVRTSYENAKISIPMVLKKLNLNQYDKHTPYKKFDDGVFYVKVPIRKHVGTPANIHVKMNQMVKLGDVIAATSEDKLGAVYHASIAGKVNDIGDDYIGITKH